MMEFPRHESCGSADADQNAQQGSRSGPSQFRSLVENEDERNDGDHRGQRTDEVECMLGYFAGVRDCCERHGDCGEDESNWQDEEPSPPCHVYQDSRHQ